MLVETIRASFKRLFICVVFFFASICAVPAAADVDLIFGVYTTDQPTEMVKAYRPILSGMEVELSNRLETPVKISLKVSSTYEMGVKQLLSGKVDFSMLGAASFISALEQNESLRLLAIESKNDSKSFNGVIAVVSDSPIESISELAGRSFAFGNKVSTIGRYLSQAYLLEHGIGSEDLANYDYLGRHDRVGHAVAVGSYDAGALKEGTFNKLVKKGLPLRALAKFPNVNKAWVASSYLDDAIFRELQSVMLSLNDESLFKPFSRKRFVAGEVADYDIIRNAINTNRRFFDKSKARSDFVLSNEY